MIKDMLLDLLKHQNNMDLKYAYKITEKHLLVTRSERHIRKAAELLSRTVANSVSYVLPGNEHVEEFSTMVNEESDVLNYTVPHHPNNKLKSAYSISLGIQDTVLNKLYDMCFSAQVIGVGGGIYYLFKLGI